MSTHHLKKLLLSLCLVALNVSATSVTVSTMNDVVDGNTSSISGLASSPGADAKISLREAIIAANNTAGANTINIPAGIYNLTVAGYNEDFASKGDLDIRMNNMSIIGAGASTTIIKQTAGDRVFDINPANLDGFSCTIQGITITGGVANESYGGGGILYSDPTTNAIGTLSLSGCVVTGNVSTNGPGGGIEVVDGNLTMTNCVVSSNSAPSSLAGEGGGIDFFAQGSAATLFIYSSVIIANKAGHADHAGGGLHITCDLDSTSAIYRSIISSNQATAATGHGGGIVNGGGGLYVLYSRITGNSSGAAPGSAIYEESTGSVDATWNWWGANTPAAGLLGAATNTFAPIYDGNMVLSVTPNNAAVLTNGTRSFTLDLFTDNHGRTIDSSFFNGLPAFPNPGVSLFQNPVLGSITLNPTALTNGTATGTFKAGLVGGNGSVQVVLDSQTITIPITVNQPANVVCPSDFSAPNDSGKCYATKPFAATVTGFPTPAVTYKISSTVITSPYQFPKGVSTVTCTVTNSTGTNSCSFNVTVVDTEAPQITCPATITANAFGNCPVTVNFAPTASDNCGVTTFFTSPASGSAFSVGTNTVIVTAADAGSNTNTCSFKVVVTPTAGPLLKVNLAGTNVVVSWPSAATCYALQSVTNLGVQSNWVWNTYPGPYYFIGTNIFITNSTPNAQLYRLKY